MACGSAVRASLCAGALLISVGSASHAQQAAPSNYAVVVSEACYADTGWKAVVDALIEKHKANAIFYRSSVTEALPQLRALFPRYTCFVAAPTDADRQFVFDVHRLLTKFDDDPYGDTFWGILTGYDAANALRIARQTEPLVIRKVAGGTEVALEMCVEGMWFCELTPGKQVRKSAGGEPSEEKGPADSTAALVAALNEYHPDLFVTSGHATERDWQIGYRYRNGSFRSRAGQLTGHDTANQSYSVASPNPKVYLPVGNCLMGHIDDPDAMALAWMNSAGVCQMIGYTVPTWFGYAGWGCLDTFVEQPGRYTLAEAFLANHHALVHRLATDYPELAKLEPKPGKPLPTRPAADTTISRADMTGLGLLHDRDVVAFYGDPAWSARMADMPKAYDQSLTITNGLYTIEIQPRRGERSFEPINLNGSQRGGRPIVQFLPGRIRNVRLVEGEDLRPLVTDDFVLIPNPRKCDPTRTYRVSFRADPAR